MRASVQTLAAIVLLSGALIISAGCSGRPIAPTYTQEELKVKCERQRGWWHRDDLLGGYCEYRTS